MKKVGIYARVSTREQNADNQLLDLRKYCLARGWDIVGEFVDVGISGTKETRPKLQEALMLAKRRQIDVLLVWRFDRFARSLPHLINTLEELQSRGVEFVSYQEAIDTSTPQGRMFFGIVASIAEFERSLIVERIHAGLRRARENGKLIGRPATSINLAEALRLRNEGLSVRKAASRMGIPKTTLARMLSHNRCKIPALAS